MWIHVKPEDQQVWSVNLYVAIRWEDSRQNADGNIHINGNKNLSAIAPTMAAS